MNSNSNTSNIFKKTKKREIQKEKKEFKENHIKIFFDNKDFFIHSEKHDKLLSKLFRELTHVSYLETLLYSAEGIYELDEKNNTLLFLDFEDKEIEKIKIKSDSKSDSKSEDIVVYCDYGTVHKIEVFKYPFQYSKMKKVCYVFSNKINSSLKLVLEKDIIHDKIIDLYCILEKNMDFKNENFYEELKEFNNLIFNV